MPPQIMMAFEHLHLDFNDLLAVFITHYHSDHSYGLKYLLEAAQGNGYKNAKFIDLYLPANLFAMVQKRKFPDQSVIHTPSENQLFFNEPGCRV